jgi:UDP-4-amino-4,6-dideoxy-N-acetyl-beta-L-altrosamine transaminase
VIPYGHQSIDDGDVEAVVAALRSDWLTQGPTIDEFEETLAATTEARYAVAFSSGTAALHAAALVGGLGPGDRVATSPLSFVASANCARYVGARPLFVDIDPATLNVDVDAVPSDVDALVAVHFAGLPVDLSRLRNRPRVVIEDGAHALGASTPDGPVGNCARSDMCAFSFHPVKTVTTGEGGAVTTNDAKLADGLRRVRNHGIERPAGRPGWYYEVHTLAFNYRMTDIQAALGQSQLGKVERFVRRRNDLAARYRQLLQDVPVSCPPAAPTGFTHAYHLFPVRVSERDHIYEAMRKAGVGVQVHYIPIYRQPLHAEGWHAASFPATEDAFESLLSLPLYPDLTEDQQDRVVNLLRGLTCAT